MPSAGRPPPATRNAANASHFTSIPWPLQNFRWRAWLRTADSNASERPWNHSRSLSGRSLTVFADVRERRRALGREAVEDLGHRLLDDAQLDALVAAREIDVVDLLVAQAGERRLLARDRRHLVAAAAHQLEERRRQLVATGDDALGEQRGHERGREVVRRLVHVLGRRAGRVLAAEAPVGEPAEQRGRHDREGEGGEDPGPRMAQRVLELAAVALRPSAAACSRAIVAASDVVVHVARVRRAGRQRRRRVEHAQDHAALGRHVLDGRQDVAAAHGHAVIEPGRLDPGARAGRAPAACTFASGWPSPLFHWSPQTCGATSTASS